MTAGLLREHAPPQALLARMEGEQFAVLLPGLSLAATERAARRLREAAATRVQVAGLDLEVTLTIGVAAAPAHGTDAGMLMQRADVALLAAAGSGGVASYHPVLDQQSLRRLQLGTELEQAMADGQITAVFQPIIDARSSDIVAVETLVRWAHPALRGHPAGGLHPPRRADRPDRRAHRPRARPRPGALPPLAGRRHRAVGGGQPVGPLPHRARPGRPHRAGAAAARRARGAAHPGADRGQRRRRLGAREHRPGRPARAGAAAVDGRLRHRLLVAVPAAPAADRRGQDRQVLRPGHVHQPGRVLHRPVDHRARRTTWACAWSPRASRTSSPATC